MSDINKLRERFKKTLEEVAKLLNIKVKEVTREDYVRVTVDNKIDKRLNKEDLVTIGGFRVAKAVVTSIKTPDEVLEEKKQIIKVLYKDYISEFGITPSIAVMTSWGFSIRDIRLSFGSVLGLYKECSSESPKIFNELVNDSIFTPEYFEELKKQVKTKKRFLITTAVSGKEVDEKALKSIKSYAVKNDAVVLILPCEDVASRGSIFKYELDKRLRDFGFVFKDLQLNSNFHISSIAVSAKQINPITGLDRIAQGNGSAILASPKQYLKFVATSSEKLPHAIMTSGAVTVSDYSSDKAMSQRTSYIASFDHVMGGVIVEIENNEVFHFRQIQFDETGSFYDLGVLYDGNKVSKAKETVCTFGDTHVGSHDLGVNEQLKDITKSVNCKEIVVHDLFDGKHISHHIEGKYVTKAMMAKKGKTNLLKEGEITADWLNEWCKLIKKITLVKSNHDEVIDRYIDEGRWMKDHENFYDAIDLVKAVMDGKDPLRFLLEEKVGLDAPNKINWLKRDQDYIVYGIENGSHGDKGSGGSRGSIASMENSTFKATIGHSHTAGILRNIYQVGTSTVMRLGYNSGASSWTNTMCIQYENGQRQLINIIKSNNKYSYKI